MINAERVHNKMLSEEKEGSSGREGWSPSFGEMKHFLSSLKIDIRYLSEDTLHSPLECFPISVRLSNVFKRENISTLNEFLSVENDSILRWSGLGKKSIRELADLVSDIKNNNLHRTSFSLLPESVIQKQGSIACKNLYPRDSSLYYAFKAKELILAASEGLRSSDISAFNFPTRLENVFRAQGIKSLNDFLVHSDREIIRWPHFGSKSLSRLCDALEFNSLGLGEGRPKGDSQYYALKARELILAAPEGLRSADIGLFNLPVRLENVFKTQRIKCLNDFLEYSGGEIIRWPGLGKKSLSQFCDLLQLDSLKSVEKNVSELTAYEQDELYDSLTLKQRFEETIGRLEKDNHRLVLEERLGINSPSKTLDEVASRLKVTRERVRQIQKSTVRKIIKGETWDDLLLNKIKHLLMTSDCPIFIDQLHKRDPWFSGFEEKPQLLLKIIELFSHLSIDSIKVDGRCIISNISQEVWDSIKRKLIDTFEFSIDLEYTLEDVEMIVERELSIKKARELSTLMFDTLYKELIFSTVNGELILTGVGNSRIQLIKSILGESKKPLHYEEIAKIYSKKYGINIVPRNVHARLNYDKNFLIFDRGVYGLKKHLCISPEKRKEILKASEDIILSDASKQWHSSEVLSRLSGHHLELLSDVLNKYTLSIILNESKIVQYLGKMMWVGGEAIGQEAERLHIRTAVANILRKNGGPMQVEAIQDDLSKVRSVPNNLQLLLQPNPLFSRIDPSTWGLLDRDFILSKKEWSSVKEKLYESLHRRGRAYHVTELLEATRNEDLPPSLTGFHIFGVMMSDGRFKNWRGNLIGLEEWNMPNRLTLAEALQVIAREAPGTIRTNDIVRRVGELLGHPFDKNTIGIHMNRNGFSFDRQENVWRRA